jgi:hypothetical protein
MLGYGWLHSCRAERIPEARRCLLGTFVAITLMFFRRSV